MHAACFPAVVGIQVGNEVKVREFLDLERGMKSLRRVRALGVRGSALACALLACGGTALAAEAYGKFRLSFMINNQSSSDGLRTNSGNTSRFEGGPLGGIMAIDDPRPDSASKNEASIKDDFRYDFEVSFGFLKWKWGELTADASVGYFKGDVGNLEVSGQFDVVDPVRITCGEVTRYHVLYVSVGQVTEIPVRLGSTLRFRPRATGGPIRGMNPYIGAGIGYMFNEIDPSGEFLKFSDNVAHSVGHYTKATGHGLSGRAGPDHQLKAAEAQAHDTFEYHVHGGIEFPINKNFLIVVSGSWMWAQEMMDITVDGKHSFGEAIPVGDTEFEYPVGGMPVVVTQGGLLDYASGRPVPKPNENCKFRIGPQDGIPDTGSYYVQAGELRYDGFTIGVGVRYQF
jgi:hypothetical protein